MEALILAGGSGTRFWPASRRRRPKQLLALDDEASLLQRTVERVEPLTGPERIWICTTGLLAREVAEQLPGVPPSHILPEPEGRNTLPAIAWSILCMPEEAREEVVVVLPADHRVGDGAAFRRTLQAAVEGVRRHDLVMTLGVTPRWPETGYGYLETGEVLDESLGLLRVDRFLEKPEREKAEELVRSGRHLWNAGIFLFRGSTLLELVAEHQPELAEGLETIRRDAGSLASVYPRLPSISIDYGIMEELDELATLPLDCEWSDLGSWTALAEVLPGDDAGNAVRGDVLAVDAEDNLLFAEEGHIAAVGVSGLAVVRTGDSVLVVPKERAQEVREVVRRLAEAGRDDLL